jgi:putative endonuclease
MWYVYPETRGPRAAPVPACRQGRGEWVIWDVAPRGRTKKLLGQRTCPWGSSILKCKNGDLYTGITDNLQRRFNEYVSGKGGHFTKSFIAEEILFSEKHQDKPSALKREAQIKGWTRKKKLALIKGDLELLNKL